MRMHAQEQANKMLLLELINSAQFELQVLLQARYNLETLPNDRYYWKKETSKHKLIVDLIAASISLALEATHQLTDINRMATAYPVATFFAELIFGNDNMLVVTPELADVVALTGASLMQSIHRDIELPHNHTLAGKVKAALTDHFDIDDVGDEEDPIILVKPGEILETMAAPLRKNPTLFTDPSA